MKPKSRAIQPAAVPASRLIDDIAVPEMLLDRINKRADYQVFFNTEAEFLDAYRLAALNRTTKEIAGFFGCPHAAVTNNDELMVWINRGWTDYRIKVESEVLRLALIDLDVIAPEEKQMYANLKQKNLNEIHKTLNKDPWVPPQEQERMKRLSNEELEAEILALANGNVRKAQVFSVLPTKEVK